MPNGIRGSRKPCSRSSGQNTPYWNQRTISSRNSGSAGSPPWKPPISVVHHGSPLTATFRPALSCPRRLAKSAAMSPDHRTAPYRWLPAHADRTRLSTSGLPPARTPSWTARGGGGGAEPRGGRSVRRQVVGPDGAPEERRCFRVRGLGDGGPHVRGEGLVRPV